MAKFGPRPRDLSERFWEKVAWSTDIDVCWEWQGGRYTKGLPYGKIEIEGKTCVAHRTGYELVYGPIPDKLLVRHRCDNPPCCNPWHLETGTHLDNGRDKAIRLRAASGDRNGSRLYPERLTRGDAHWTKHVDLSGANNPHFGVPKCVGEENPNHTLTLAEVKQLLIDYATVRSQRKLARQYGISKTQVARILRGESWRASLS